MDDVRQTGNDRHGGAERGDDGHPVDDQAEVLAFLADPASHGLPAHRETHREADQDAGEGASGQGPAVRRIDTHSAVVFLAGDRVYKIKRAVRYPFLDFSTLEKRKAACEAELEVNRVFAPGIYLRVTPVTRGKDGALRLGGKDPAAEWAVELRRFDENKTLDRIADAHGIDPGLADSLARAVARTHREVKVMDGGSFVAALGDYIEQNHAAFCARPELFDPASAKTLAGDMRRALDRLRPLLLARGAEGLVRRGHGDLHLANVVLVDGEPMLFDAVEFSDRIATGDVLYDLGFLLMDLVGRDLRAAADIVLNRYLAETRRPSDLDALAALPLFMAMRAAIRANVTASRAALAGGREREEAGVSAGRYFALACALIRPGPPVLVGVGGLSGTGKSWLARALAPDLPPSPGAVVVRSDVERKAMAGRREDERLGEEAYSAQNTGRVYAALVEKAQRIVAAGHSTVVDAVFAGPQERDRLRQAARAHGVTFHGLFLCADEPTRLERVRARRGDASDAGEAVVRAQECYALGDNDWDLVDASGSVDDVLSSARRAVHPR